MSKELTEQWRNGTLEDGFYYVKFPEEGVEMVNTYMLKQLALVSDADKIEVLAPVPTYNEYLESESHCAVYSEVNQWNKEKIDELEKQLIEANAIIKSLKDARSQSVNEYLEKWGVK